jgi:hypothetical protein
MPVVSVTRLRVRSVFFLPSFLFRAMRIGRQASKASGSLHVRVLNESRNVFWTSTSWESESDMRAFMIAAPHGPTMHKLLEWCDEAALVHWTQNSAELPSWSEAHRRMQSDGRRSKVRHPSEAHNKFEIAAPPSNPRGEVRFKSHA